MDWTLNSYKRHDHFRSKISNTSNLCFPLSFPSNTNTRPKLDWVWISKPFIYVKAFLKRNVVLAGFSSVPDTKSFFFNAWCILSLTPKKKKNYFCTKRSLMKLKYGFFKKLIWYKWTSDQLNTFILTFCPDQHWSGQKVRKKVVNWSDVHLYLSNF